MNTINICARSARTLFVAAAFGLVLWPTALAGQGTAGEVISTPGQVTSSTSVTGSGAQYTTTIDRKTQGELKPEDLRQVSVWSSRIMLHVDHADRDLGEASHTEGKGRTGRGTVTGQARARVTAGHGDFDDGEGLTWR